ncbi:acyltransferase [Plectonema radiosum NIES-515]|uniref:Acyltransferase n=1 Tax=Plectonema radiosum NIES-515 TaxID=2986073 RepID=A0ABT3B2M2_9CYAN|nr:acyltransferase [Plectonema radiosum]MCV3215250.1 acyltransferase [Plectonema radiosum NIES-515]
MKQLDGLRAIAVFAVLYTHYLPKNYWIFGIYWGELGVKLFFVLSGFLITSILLKCRQYIASGKQTRFFTLRQFYIRRFLRLFPLYYATLALAALVNIPPVRETIAWHIPYLSNVYFAIRGDFYDSVSHFWSLAVEEQFYLLLPWLILFLPKKSLLPTIIILILVGPLFRLAGPIVGLNQVAIWVLMPSSLDTLGLGSLLAYLRHQEELFNISTKKLVNVFVLIGLPLWLLINIINRIHSPILIANILHDTALGLIFTWLIAQASRGFKGIIGDIMESKPLIYIGKISYGIYVIHNFMPYVVRKAFDVFGLSSYNSQLVIALFSTVATIILATISWHFLEKPINDFKKFFEYTHKVAN